MKKHPAIRLLSLLLTLILLLTAAACGGSGGAGTDTEPDTAPDTLPGTLPDTQPDTVPETSPDTQPPSDTTPDEPDDTEPAETTPGGPGYNENGVADYVLAPDDDPSGYRHTVFAREEETEGGGRPAGFSDPLNDWSIAAAHGEGLGFDTSHGGYLGDDSRVVKTSTAAEDAWITYDVPEGIAYAAIAVISSEVDGERIDGLRLELSADGQTWREVTPNETTDAVIDGGWFRRVYEYDNADLSLTHARVTFLPSANENDPSYNPNLSFVQFNETVTGTMDPYEGLEGRASHVYYVDDDLGNDDNDGLSPETAFRTVRRVSEIYFQPDDALLFKRGGRFSGSLTVRGVGEEGHPIIVGCYGDVSLGLPQLIGRGGTALTVLADWIIVEHLDVTNPNGECGIMVNPNREGAVRGVVIRNNTVHDVNVKDDLFDYANSGIYVKATGSAPTWYEGLLIEGNTITHTSRTGIFLDTDWAVRPGWGYGKNGSMYVNDDKGWFPAEHAVIRGNVVDHPHGDGILVIGGRDTLIEYNTVLHAFASEKTFDRVIACAALWTINTNYTVVQYNEVGYTRLPIEQNGADGEGFDIDGIEVGTTIQYNYSHDNEGGFILLCDTAEARNISRDHVIRYNLSVNDACRGQGQGVFMIASSWADTQIYNNTIVAREDGRSLIFSFADAGHFHFTNNLFVGSTMVTRANETVLSDVTLINNIYAGTKRHREDKTFTYENTREADVGFTDAKSAAPAREEAFGKYRPTAPGAVEGAALIECGLTEDISGTPIGAPFYGCLVPGNGE